MMNFAKILCLVSTATAIVLRRDAVAVENDISQSIAPAWTALDNDVNGFPASGLSGALAIHADVQDLVTIFNSATTDVQAAGSFSEADLTNILEDIQSLAPTILDTFSTVQSQKEDWRAIPGGQALISNDFQSLSFSSAGFFTALTAASPADLVPVATTLEAQIAGGFQNIITAYSA
ncbi:hydrophobic surface binding protein A domain-containing protein [Trichoderma chlorosporum]